MATKRTIEALHETGTFNDNSNHNLCVFTIPDNSAVYAEATITGKDSSNNAIVMKKSTAATKTTGNVALEGGLISLLSSINAANVGATGVVVVSGSTIMVQVNGPTIAKSIEWQVELRIHIN